MHVFGIAPNEIIESCNEMLLTVFIVKSKLSAYANFSKLCQ